MAGGHPQYGGTNGVSLLDIGQAGGSRAGAGTATAVIVGHRGPERARIAEHQLPQLNGKFEDHLGYDGGSVEWEATIKAANAAALEAVFSDINRKVTGLVRTAGSFGAMNPVEIRETRLTDYDGTIISERARIRSWDVPERRYRTPEGKAIARVRVRFELLG